MEINSQRVDELISDFKKNKEKIFVKPENLVQFNLQNPEDAEFHSYVNGTDHGGYYVRFLHNLVSKLQPKVIVELGNREGVSTLSIFDALQKYQGEFYTVDIEKDQRYCPPQMFTDPKVHFLFGDVSSYDIVKQIPKQIDFLFSDTIHYNFQIEDEFEIYQHLLADTALFAIDDIKLNDKGKFFDNVAYSKWDLTELCHVSGWGLFLFQRKEKVTPEEQQKRLIESIMKVWERKYNKVYAETCKPTFKDKLKTQLKKTGPLYTLLVKIVCLLKK
ncbi:MAG: class I SAM-dependent methyltransferase [Patescibacteria group bacterium]